MQFKKHEFDLIKDEMKKGIESQLELVPQLKAIVNFFTLVLKDYHHSDRILKQLSNLNLDEFNTFLKGITTNSYVKSFVHGNIQREQAKTLYNETVHKYFKSSKSPVPSLTNYKNNHADLSGYFIFREQLSKTYNINHAILNFYQIGHDNIRNIILAHMVKSLCGNIYFTELRIKEQLGYTTKGKIFAEGNYLVKMNSYS
jgi:secreted Zn-dependent insulinase-like peptidase